MEIAPRAAREIRKLPRHIQARVIDAATALQDDPRPHGAKLLAGARDLWRVRSGNYRVLYRIQDDALIVLVVRVADRREVYRRLGEI